MRASVCGAADSAGSEQGFIDGVGVPVAQRDGHGVDRSSVGVIDVDVEVVVAGRSAGDR
ncbi:hypothetical protein [Nocardia cyriacigeorgica]|uniref:hypothetical protein n=1 Tax=Nocardia cyriacigeorgica TaxID=135487 RepID=UPI0014869836|nr:hypothetical protein [Nocardia cyriacigeorgica]